MKQVRIRVDALDQPWEIVARAAAAVVCGCRVTVSREDGIHESLVNLFEAMTHDWAGDIEFVEESEAQFCQAIRTHQADRLRFSNPDRVSVSVRKAATEAHVHVADSPVTPHGRIELLWYVEEQSFCFDYHRYGNLGVRSKEKRTEPT